MFKIGDNYIDPTDAKHIEFLHETTVIMAWSSGGISNLTGPKEDVQKLRDYIEALVAVDANAATLLRADGPFFVAWERARAEVDIEMWKEEELQRRRSDSLVQGREQFLQTLGQAAGDPPASYTPAPRGDAGNDL